MKFDTFSGGLIWAWIWVSGAVSILGETVTTVNNKTQTTQRWVASTDASIDAENELVVETSCQCGGL